MAIKPTHLRQDLYQMLDQVLATGVPLEIERNGKILRLVPAEPVRKLDRLQTRLDYLGVPPEDLVHIDWSREWRP